MLEAYAAELTKRKIEAKVDHRGDSLSFELHFRNGGYHGFTLSAGKIRQTLPRRGDASASTNGIFPTAST
jgi:hypothetical protein